MITIVDYGMGNIGSIANMLRKVGAASTVTADPQAVRAATKLILPGVGAFDHGMRHLEERGLLEALHHKALEERVPVLGICLGMQLLTRGSEEGERPGLGWVEAHTRRFQVDAALRIPHMGWNVAAPAKASPLLEGLPDPARFYFVHSFHVMCENEDDVLMRTTYGDAFTSAVQRGNVMGVQFHPEKSHKFGMHLLKRFAEL